MPDFNETGFDKISLLRGTKQDLIDNKDKMNEYEIGIAKDTQQLVYKENDEIVTLNGKVTTYDTIEDLKKANIKTGEVVEVLGYYSKDDIATHKRVISDTDDGSGVLLDNGKYANLIKETVNTPRCFGWTFEDSQENKDILTKYVKLGYAKNTYTKIYDSGTFLTQWISDNKFPIAFYGDSTTDGATTTGHKANYSTGTGFDANIVINDSPNSYSNKLQQYIKSIIGSGAIVDIYNAGFDSMSLSNDFGIDFFNRVFFGFKTGRNNVDYSDVKGIVLVWGTSDSINKDDTNTILQSYPHKLEMLVINCFERGIQPFICHPVLNFKRKGSLTTGRDNDESISIIENINNRIAKKYNLEVFSLREALETYVENAYGQKGDFLEVLAPDGVHPNDKGHRMIASYFTHKFCNLVKVKEEGYKFTAGNPYVITEPKVNGNDIWKIVDNTILVTNTSFFYKFADVDQNQFLYRFFVYCDKPIDIVYQGLSINKAFNGDKTGVPSVNIKNYVNDESISKNLFSDYEGASAPITSGGFFKITKLNVGLNMIQVNAPIKEGKHTVNLGYFQLVDVNENVIYGQTRLYTGNNIYELSGSVTGQRWSEKLFREDGSNYYTSDLGTWKYILFRANTLDKRAVLFSANRKKEDFDTFNKIKFEGDKYYCYVVSEGVETLLQSGTLNIDISTLKDNIFQFQILHNGTTQSVYLSYINKDDNIVRHMTNFNLRNKFLLNGGFGFGIEKYDSTDSSSIACTNVNIKYSY